MSVPFQIEAIFDGVTDFSLAKPTELVPGSQIRRFVPDAGGPAGVLDFQTIPNFAFSPLWIWAMSLGSMPPLAIGTVELRLQDGTRLPLIDTAADPNPCWNILMPQGSDLVVEVDDGVGAPTTGILYYQISGVAADDWYKLQCCHKFAPDLFTVGGG